MKKSKTLDLNNNRKSQSEIVGIAIVMVLVMIGIVFVIRFVILPQDQKQNLWGIYGREQMASDFINSLLKTSTNCNSRSIAELIRDCAEHTQDPGMQYSCAPDSQLINSICASTTCRSCDFMKSTINYIANNSLDPLYVRYDLEICKWDEVAGVCGTGPVDMLFNRSRDSCKNAKIDFGFNQIPVPTDIGIRSAVLYMCDY